MWNWILYWRIQKLFMYLLNLQNLKDHTTRKHEAQVPNSLFLTQQQSQTIKRNKPWLKPADFDDDDF